MKNHIIDFKSCLASIPNEDLELAVKVFAKEIEGRGAPIKQKLNSSLKSLSIKNPEWKFAAKRFIDKDYVLSEISEAFCVTPEDVKGRSRKAMITMARHVYRYVMYKIEWGVLEDIADLTEGDAKYARHATVKNSIEKVESLKFNKKLQSVLEYADNMVEELKKQIHDSLRND